MEVSNDPLLQTTDKIEDSEDPQQQHVKIVYSNDDGNVLSHNYCPVKDTFPPSSIGWITEIRMQCWLAGPLIVGNLLNFCLQIISISFVGRIGELELSAASIASSFTMVTGFSVVSGMGYALETLCGQAFGAQQYHKLGVYTQRGMFVLNVISLPLAYVWANMEYILLCIGQDRKIASKAGEYALWVIPTLFGSATSQPFVKFLQAQSIVSPILIISLGTLLCHVPICTFLVFKSGLGYRGAALATSISSWIDVIFLALYVHFSKKCSKSWVPPTLQAFQDLKPFFKLAIPSAAMICLEWWSYEVLVILSGLLPNPEVQTAGVSICVNTQSLTFMIPMALSAAASTRVSNELGAGHPEAARAAVRVATLLAFAEASLVAGLLMIIRNIWGFLYTNEKDVVHLVSELIPFLSLATVFDGLQSVLQGVVRGAGWQTAGAFINLGSFYVAGLPVGCCLAFLTYLEGKGLMIGMVVGVFVQFVAICIITHGTDGQEEATKVAALLDDDNLSRLN